MCDTSLLEGYGGLIYLARASRIALGLIAEVLDVRECQQGAAFGNLKSLKVCEIKMQG